MSEKAQKQTEAARFGFGANWARYLTLVDDERIATAEQSLKEMLKVDSLEERRFLDVGSGSGLFLGRAALHRGHMAGDGKCCAAGR